MESAGHGGRLHKEVSDKWSKKIAKATPPRVLVLPEFFPTAVQQCLPFMCTGGVMRSLVPSFSKHRQSLDRDLVAREIGLLERKHFLTSQVEEAPGSRV